MVKLLRAFYHQSMEIQKNETKCTKDVPGYIDFVEDLRELLKKHQLDGYMQKTICAIVKTTESCSSSKNSQGTILDDTLANVTRKLAPHIDYIPTREIEFKREILKQKRKLITKLENKIRKVREELERTGVQIDEKKLNVDILFDDGMQHNFNIEQARSFDSLMLNINDVGNGDTRRGIN